MLNKVIPYIICQGPTGLKPFDRAYHPEEYYERSLGDSEGGQLLVDGYYYLDSQIYKPINRILTNIKEVDIKKVGEILNLDHKLVTQVVIERTKEEAKEYKQQRELTKELTGKAENLGPQGPAPEDQ